MHNSIVATLFRDLNTLTQRRFFWLAIASWVSLCSIIYFAYIEDFLAIQSLLRSKNSHFGVTEIVIIPYLKTLGFVGTFFIISLCSRLFYHEHFSVFSPMYRSTMPNVNRLIFAKMSYIFLTVLWVLGLLALPPLVSIFFYDYHFSHVVITLFAQFVLLFSVGLLSMLLSQLFKHSILTMLMTISLMGSLELISRWVVEPIWINSLVVFFSPISHVNRIATGIITLSDCVFFICLWGILIALSKRQFNNTYLTLS